MLDADVRDAEDSPSPILAYVQMLACLIEGRQVRLAEIREMLARGLRQQGIAWRRELDHIVGSLREHPA